jgi:hypothetical protein
MSPAAHSQEEIVRLVKTFAYAKVLANKGRSGQILWHQVIDGLRCSISLQARSPA